MDDLKQPPGWFPCLESLAAMVQDIDALELALARAQEEVRLVSGDDQLTDALLALGSGPGEK